jgi:hypothetical protein
MAEFGWAYVAGGAITGAAGPTGSIQIKQGPTEIGGYSELVWNTGSNTLELAGDISSSANISASYFYGDGSNLTNVGSDLTIQEEGSNITTAATSINFVGAFVTASASGTDVTVTINAGGSGGSGVIGNAEDGDYTDGLYTDFTPSTAIGIPIDRFNELFKILAPSPAPSLSRINYDNSDGETVKLSFGSSNALSDYTSSNTTAGFDAVDVSQSYAAATSGSNYRLGVYANDTDITGFLNFQVSEVSQNGYIAYSNDAFANAETGSLKLEINGNIVHSVDLSGLVGSGNPNSGSAVSLTGDSGFTNISVTASSFDGNNSEWYIFKHRTAKFKIDVNDMVPGWNYARVIHTISSTNYETNYVEWINDPSGAVDDLSVSNARIEDITLVGSKYLSGVEYNTDATANYKADINNLYRNVYQVSGTPISFTVSNSTTPSAQSVADIDTGAGEDHTKVLGITASLDYNSDSLVNGAITANVTVTHPFKATISNQGSATTGNGFLIDNRTLASTNTSEKFHDETYRKTSGSYDLQTDVTAGSALWNSENHMTGGGASGHTDGLLYFNQRLYSPIDGDVPAGGDFSSLSNVESGQPDYSGVTGTRTFYRVVSNSSGADLYNMTITSTKNSTTYNNSTLSTANAHFYVKLPETTGWMDISQNFSYGSVSDGDGALIAGASNDTDSGNNTHYITFGTASVANGDHIMIKIEADESWAGYISQLDFTLPANQSQATPQVLSDIDGNDVGITAKLSFGASNLIDNYSNATASVISSIDYNSNSIYTYGGASSNRRGVFSSFPVMDGALNDAIGVGSGYPSDAFFNGYSGSLILEVNGIEVHSIDLASTLSAINTTNVNGSRLNVSAVSFSTLSNIPDYTKPYRTGTYQVAAGDQNSGWNYVKVIHRTSGDQVTNYVHWVVDPSGSVDDTAVSTPILSNFNHTDLYYQSGIGYFASRPTASFEYTASNFYRNVYESGTAISFPTTTNCSITNIRTSGSGINTGDFAVSQTSMPLLNNTADCELTDIQITGTVLFDSLTSISGGLGLFTDYDVTVDGRVVHPFKSDRTTSTASKTSFMVYSGSIGSTNLTNEYFNTEDYRIVSGNYVSQSNTTSSANSWNSEYSMNDGATYPAYNDGMVTVNGYAISPLNIGVAGDTRNADDGGSLQAPSGNPNYSSLSESVRTYYRYFRNETGLAKATFTVSLYGDANLISKSGAFYTGTLGANKNIQVELKVPFDPSYTGLDDTSTAWGDCIKPYELGTQPTSDGVGIFNGGGSDLNQTVDGSGRDIAIQLQGSQVRDDQYFVLKISAHEDWTGYLSRIAITY